MVLLFGALAVIETAETKAADCLLECAVTDPPPGQEDAEADRRAREQYQARREQAERDRRAAEDRRNRENRPGRLAPDSYTPSPYDWRSRQHSNSQEKP